MRLRGRRSIDRSRQRMRDAALFGAGAATAALATVFDKRRRHIVRDRSAATVRDLARAMRRRADYNAGVARGVAHAVTGPLHREQREYDDVTLVRKVESELFRSNRGTKSHVSVNAQNGVVELRGQLDRAEDIEALGIAAARIEGVKEVHNLLHTPGSPPKHTPAGDRGELRASLDDPASSSRLPRFRRRLPGRRAARGSTPVH